ncbi:MAG TPA: diacylglycerol kinase family protein, partial [Chthonomonadaceae bacterium]|nr:diacylglycerol kinase family protein [Chthonomonadaceae bacterium]
RDVAAGLAGTPALLGVLPLGTGNDLARALGLYGSLERAVETLFTGRPRRLDLGCALGRPFLVAAGCGFDAVVAARVNRGGPLLRGTAAYIAAVLECLQTFRPAALRLTLDGQPLEARAMLCTVANAPTYGGGMRIAPDARLDDGWLDVCLVGDVGRVEFLRAFPRVFRGTHVTHPKVTMLRARHICVESDPPLPVNVDGDVLGATPATFTLAPHAISVLAP